MDKTEEQGAELPVKCFWINKINTHTHNLLILNYRSLDNLIMLFSFKTDFYYNTLKNDWEKQPFLKYN